MPTLPADDQGAADRGTGGALVGIAYANNGVEAQMIQGLLENGGIPSLLKPAGLDGSQGSFIGIRPGYGGGPQRVLVHADRAEQARSLLAETLVEDEEELAPEI